MLQAQTLFYSTTINSIRRELVTYGVVLSNLANATKMQRQALVGIATYVLNYIKRNQPKPNKAHPLDMGPPAPAPRTYLPRAFISIIGAHACRCHQCDTEFQQDLLDAVKKRAVDDYAKILEQDVVENMRNDLISKYWDELNTEAEPSARKIMRDRSFSRRLIDTRKVSAKNTRRSSERRCTRKYTRR